MLKHCNTNKPSVFCLVQFAKKQASNPAGKQASCAGFSEQLHYRMHPMFPNRDVSAYS